VTCAAKQLDAVAQLLQQTRTQLQAASSSGTSPGQALMQAGAPGLLGEPEALDELLFLTYLQAQYSSGGWAEGVGLFRQLQQVRSMIICPYASQQVSQRMSACAGLVDIAIGFCCRGAVAQVQVSISCWPSAT